MLIQRQTITQNNADLPHKIIFNLNHFEILVFLLREEYFKVIACCRISGHLDSAWDEVKSPNIIGSIATMTIVGNVTFIEKHNFIVFISLLNFGWVSDKDAQHRPLTRNATKCQKVGSQLYISQNFDKNRDRNFPHFLFKYRGRNYTNFPETWKRGVKMADHM